MRILVVSPQLPLPLDDGGRKATFYPIKYLVGMGHRIHLACLSTGASPMMLDEMQRYCTVDVVLHDKRPKLSGALRMLLSETPYLLSRFHNAALAEKIHQRLQESFDIVILEGLHCAYYGVEIKSYTRLPVLLRLHNVESSILERFIVQQKNPFFRLYAQRELKKLLRYEQQVYPLFERVLAISKDDKDTVVRQSHLPTIEVVPAGVDMDYFAPQERREEPDSVLWMGSLHWPPNRDSFWWFVKTILPKVIARGVHIKVYVVGANPPQEIKEFRHPNVVLLGHVEDVRHIVARAAVCVVPLRIGGGIRIKMLEFFSMAKAVVSTRIGCEGLDVSGGRELMVADDPSAFAQAIAELLLDPRKRAQLGENARSFVKRNYSWEYITERYDGILRAVAGAAPRGERATPQVLSQTQTEH